jgi:hypothetical protein
MPASIAEAIQTVRWSQGKNGPLPIVPTARVPQPVAEKLSLYERFQSDYPDFVSDMEGLRREFSARCQRLGALNRSQQHSAIRRLLRMRHLYPVFAFDALKRCQGFSNASPNTVEALGQQFDPFNLVNDEAVVIRTTAHANGGGRVICDFGPRRRMHQQVVAKILRQIHPPLENQFLFNGGMPMALQAIEAAISDGATHACELDFVGFYGGVSFDGLVDVMRPLPASVSAHVVWDTRMRIGDLFVPVSSSVSVPTPEPPTGIYLGSSCSPIVGEVLISRLLEAAQLPRVVTYADNLCVLGTSEAEVRERIDQLQRVLANPPFACVSGLRLRVGEVRSVVDPDRPSINSIEFAKHESIGGQDETTHKPVITGWKPTPIRMAEFQVRVDEGASAKQLRRAIKGVKSRYRYYPRWPEAKKWETEYVASLSARLYMNTRADHHLVSAVSAILDALVVWEGDKNVDDFLPDYDERLVAAVQSRIEQINALPPGSVRPRRRHAILD